VNRILHKLWLWFWHLLPANPILVRVVYGASRRTRHLWLRTGYLSALLLVVLFSLALSMSGPSASLADLAKGASQTFKFASMAQLFMMCFLAPAFTAAAITQERDAQTFSILLSTPLSGAQIVFGSLMSRLYFVITLLVAGLPIFLMTMVYGGVTTSQMVESFALSGSTAILAGAIAIFVAMLGVGTRRTIYSFYLLIGLYLSCVYLLSFWHPTWVDASPGNIDGRKMSWLTPLHPFLALDVALNRVYAPPYERLGGYSSTVRYALAYPSTAYVIWTTITAFLLTVGSILFVRRSAKIGEATFLASLLARLGKRITGERTRPPRSVWNNPVAWREAKVRASGGGLLRLAIIAAGFAGPATLVLYHFGGGLSATELPRWLAALILIQFAVALTIATNTAATSMTKEKESRTIDLLLSTPLTSKYILWGKLRGLVSFAIPLLAGPVLVLLLLALHGLFRDAGQPIIWLETAPEVAALLVIYTAAACVLGLSISLRTRRNVTAVMYSVGVVILLSGVFSMIGFALVEASGGEFGAFLAPFAPFTSVKFLVHPRALFDTASEFSQGAAAARAAALLGCTLAVGLYTFIVWRAYAFLVRSFDMTLRKQSGL
jgi:ABC-type transport system involved in multi-copper enzyme maturation permease subunit